VQGTNLFWSSSLTELQVFEMEGNFTSKKAPYLGMILDKI